MMSQPKNRILSLGHQRISWSLQGGFPSQNCSELEVSRKLGYRRREMGWKRMMCTFLAVARGI